MNDTANLPEVWKTHLDASKFNELLKDLKDQAEILAVQEKHSALEYTSGVSASDATFERLRAGQFHSVQIHYRFEGRKWCDTLVKRADGIHLIRIDITDAEQVNLTNVPG